MKHEVVLPVEVRKTFYYYYEIRMAAWSRKKTESVVLVAFCVREFLLNQGTDVYFEFFVTLLSLNRNKSS